MIKVKDGYAKLIGTTYSGSADRVLLSNGGDKAVSDFAAASGVVTALGTNGNYVTWTKNGTANNLTVPYSSISGGLTGVYSTSLPSNTLDTGCIKYYYNINFGTEGLFNHNNNANGILSISKHQGNYLSQFGFSSDGRLYFRSANGVDINSLAWKTIAYVSEIPTKVSQLTNDAGYLTSLPSHEHGYIISNATSKVKGLTYYTATGISETLADGNSWCKPAGVGSDGNSMILRMRWSSGVYGHDIFASPNTQTLWHRNIQNNTNTWRELLDSGNYSSYALPLSGGTLTSSSKVPLIIKSTDTYSCIRFTSKNIDQVTFGIKENGTLFVTNIGGWSNEHVIYHSGNLTKSSIGLGNVQNTAFYKRVATVNGEGWNMAGTNSNNAFTIYAPTTAGTSGQVLTSSGGTPSWTNQSSLSVGTAANADTVDNKHAYDFVYYFTTGANFDCNETGIHSATYRLGNTPINSFPNASWSNLLVIGGGDTMTQIGCPYNADALYFRRGTWYSDGTGSIRTNVWKSIIHEGNFNSYAPKLDGTGASGTWGINISGNANTATSATSSSYARNLLGRNTSGSDYGATDGNLVFAEWNTYGDNRWYLKAKGYETRVGYANNSDKLDGYHAGLTNNSVSIYVPFPSWSSLKNSGYINANYGTSGYGHPDEEFLKGICKWAIATYPNQGDITLMGTIAPNSSGTCILHLYSDSGKDSSTLLPRYCRGQYLNLSGYLYHFGTTNYVWSYNRFAFASELKNPTNYYWANVPISATSNSATSPTFANASITGDVAAGRVIIYDGINSHLYLKTASAGANASLSGYNTGGAYGADVVLNSGSALVLGAGESASTMYSNNVDSLQGSENLYLSADGSVKIFTNCDTIANRKLAVHFNTSGYAYFGSYINIGGHEKNASSPTYVWGSNDTDSFLRSYKTSSLSVKHASTSDYTNQAKSLEYKSLPSSTSNATNTVWCKFARITYNTSAWCNAAGYFIFSGGESTDHAGILSYHFRAGSTATTNSIAILEWLVKNRDTATVIAEKVDDNIYDLYINNYSSYTCPIIYHMTAQPDRFAWNVGSWTSTKPTAAYTSKDSGRVNYATTSSSSTTVGDGTIILVPQNNNEINIGGTNTSSAIYFGYRATGSKPIPTAFVFGGSTGSASITASKFIKSGGTSSQLLRADGGVATFNWSGQSGQPTWLWGGNDKNSYYVYNPANFNVNSATILLTNNTAQAADACYDESPGLRFWRFNGTGNDIGGGDGWIMSWSWNTGSVGGQIYLDDNPSKTMAIRGRNNDADKTFTSWSKFLHSSNYTEYTVKKDGTGASGTWGINITGSAGSATTASRLGLNGIADSTAYGSYAGIIQTNSGGPESGSWHNSLKILHNNSAGYYTQLAHNFTGSHGLWHRSNRAGTISRWYRLIDDQGGTVYGNLILQSSSGDSPILQFTRGGAVGDSSGLWDWRMFSSGGHFLLQTDQGNGTWSTKLFINTSHQTGIGTESPSHTLHVSGDLAASVVYANRSGSSTSGGVSLYSNSAPDTYGIMFRGTSSYGKHGSVTGDWATYFTMSDTLNRGWIFRRGSSNVASIAGTGAGSFTAVGTDKYIAYPQGGQYTYSSGGITGAIKIKLPVSKSSTMMSMTITIYNYSTGTSATYYVGGYNYSDGNWYSEFAYSNRQGTSSLGNLPVRFGNDGSTDCIYIGETTTRWSYPNIVVSNVLLGHSTQSVSSWATGWEISITTSLGTINKTVTNPAMNYSSEYADSASTVTVNNSDSNSTYRMVWHSGNSLYSTAGIYCNPSTDYLYATSMNASDWFRSSGNTGWYNPTNNCHVYPNATTTYGGLMLRGEKGGYTGFILGNSTNYMNLMDNGTDKGLYQEGKLWILYYNRSTNYVGIRTSSLSYPLTINGDSYTNGWSRAASGFYVHDTGVYFTHQGTLGEIDMTSNNEFLWGSSSADLYFNYRAVSRGTTVTHYRWHAGSSSTYATHTLGALTAKGNQTLYGLTSTCNAGNDASYTKAAMQIREYNFGGSQDNTWAIAPRLAWHWSGRVQAQIGLYSDNHLYISEDGNFSTPRLILHSGNTYVSSGKGVINGTTITQVNNADTVDNVHLEWSGSQAASNTEWLAGWTADGTKIKAVKRSDLSVNNLNRLSGGFSVSSAGWYKLAYIKSTDARGSVRLALITTGGNYTPRYTELKVSNGWSTIVFNQNGKFDWISKYRYTTDSTYSYIEAYFTGACTITLYTFNGTGYVDDSYSGWQVYSAATAGSGTVAETYDHLTSSSLYTSGHFHTPSNAYAAHFYENSDANLKKNIKAILDFDNIPVIKEFDWKSDGTHSYGLIAQELEEQGYSELVSDSGSHKTVNYSAALSLIVGKLQNKIKELEKEIENLKLRN